MQNTGSSETAFKKQAVSAPMRLIRGLHLFCLGVLRPSRSLNNSNFYFIGIFPYVFCTFLCRVPLTLYQLFLVYYFCFCIAAEFIIYFVVIIYRTILTLLICSMIFAAASVFLTKCLLEIMYRIVTTM